LTSHSFATYPNGDAKLIKEGRGRTRIQERGRKDGEMCVATSWRGRERKLLKINSHSKKKGFLGKTGKRTWRERYGLERVRRKLGCFPFNRRNHVAWIERGWY